MNGSSEETEMIENGSTRRWDGWTSKGDIDFEVCHIYQWLSTPATAESLEE